MSRQHCELHSMLAGPINAFLQYKRALGCKYRTEAAALHLLDAYVADRRAMTWEQIDSGLVDAFLASRPRSHARSYNNLVAVTHRFFVIQTGLLAQRTIISQQVIAFGLRQRTPICACGEILECL